MGIFSRTKPKEEPVVEQRDNTQESYTVPIGLDFLTPYLSKVEATAVSALFAGVQLISSTLASTPLHIRETKSGEIINHPIELAFDSSLQSRFTIIKQMIFDLYIHGNGVAYIKRSANGVPVEIIYAPYGSYSIMYTETPRKLYYLFPGITTKKVEPVNVLHLVLNSKNGIEGKGIPVYAKKILDIALATDNHAKNYFENGASIDGILQSTKPLTSAQKIDIKQSWQQVHGPGKTGGIAVLGADMNYTPIGSNANDSEMIESRKWNCEEVARFLNVDPIILGINSGSTYNSIEQAQLAFLSHCIYPLISLVEAEFNRKLLLPSEKGSLYIDFDEAHIMFADKAATANYYSTLTKNGILSINESRHALGFAPIPNGDEHYMLFTDLNQNKIGGTQENKEENKDE